jgi:hypothetical protein
MTEENRPTVVEMLRTTGMNTAEFMEQVALHVEKLEMEVARLRERVADMEVSDHDAK